MYQLLSRFFGQETEPQPMPCVQTDVKLSTDTMQRIRERGVLLACASETGFIDDMADMTRRDLKSAGIPVHLVELNEVDAAVLSRETPVLFMTSTTGSGDAPFAADRFCEEVMTESVNLAHLYFGLLSAGDRSYDTFCGFGHELRDWLLANGARPLFDPVDVDCEDDEATRHWRHHVKHVFAKQAASVSRAGNQAVWAQESGAPR